jgi:hypothetical protein
MARRGGEAGAKWARRRARLVKRQAKRVASERLWLRNWSAATETALLGELARVSAQYEANAISQANYTDERRRILTKLGIETD